MLIKSKLRLYLQLLMLFPIFTLFQSMQYLGWINKVLFIVVFGLQLLIQFQDFKIYKKSVLPLILTAVCYAVSLYYTVFPLYNSNMLFYFAFWVLFAFLFVEYKDKIESNVGKILTMNRIIIILWTVIVGLSIFLPSSYAKNEDWGNGLYFVSITDSAFRLAPSALMVVTMVLLDFCYTGKRSLILLLIVPAYSFFMCGSRTYLLVGLLVLFIFWYVYVRKKIYFYLSLLPLCALAAYLIFNSAAGAKILATTYTSKSYFDYWGTITNGRTVFWKIDIEHFLDQGIIKRLFGCGINYDYVVTEKFYMDAHWAHNDFLSIGMQFGYVGLAVYLFSIFALFKKYFSKSLIPLPLKIVCIVIWLFNAFFNMFYCYTCSAICFPFMIIALSYYYKRSDETDECLEIEEKT